MPDNNQNDEKKDEENLVLPLPFVKFNHVRVPDIFKDSCPWENIPPFSVITGENGVGKTRLINYLKDYYLDVFSESSHESEIVYIDSSYEFGHYSISSPLYEHEFNEIEIKTIITKVHSYFKNLDLSLEDRIEDMMGDAFVISGLEVDPCQEMLDDIIKKIRANIKNRKIDKENINEVYIHTILKEYIPYDLQKIKLEQPINFLQYIVFKSHGRVDNPNEKSPLAEINEVLDKYGFNYNIDVKRSEKYEKKLVFKKNGHEVNPFHFCSGENMMLSMMAWLYYAQGFRASSNEVRRINNKVKIIFLDEPDKHLDPYLCKLFYSIIYEEIVKKQKIQVIMTTHRIDTIALAPERSIYTIVAHEDKIEKIEPYSKMRAIAKLTKNVADFTHFRVKVYAEALNDALFYGNVYKHLKLFEKNVRHNRFFSRRWQPEFQSVGFDESLDGGGGGCEAVINNLVQNLTTCQELDSLPDSLFRPSTTRPFGILDDDGGKTTRRYKDVLSKQLGGIDRGQDEKHREYFRRMSFLPRNSLENFLYDPFIITSILTPQEIEGNIGNARIREALLKLKHASDESTIQQAAQEYFDLIQNILEKFRKMVALSKHVSGFIINDLFKSEELIEIENQIQEKKAGGSSKEEVERLKQKRKEIVEKNIGNKVKELKSLSFFNHSQNISEFIKKNWGELLKDNEQHDIFIQILYREIEFILSSNLVFSDGYLKLRNYSDFEKILRKKPLSSPKMLKALNEESEEKLPDLGDSQIPTYPVRLYIVGRDVFINYPPHFLATRGHNIEDLFMCVENIIDQNNFSTYCAFKHNLVKKFVTKAKKMAIPADLVVLMNELSNKIRKQVNEVAKAGVHIESEKRFSPDRWKARKLGKTNKSVDDLGDEKNDSMRGGNNSSSNSSIFPRSSSSSSSISSSSVHAGVELSRNSSRTSPVSSSSYAPSNFFRTGSPRKVFQLSEELQIDLSILTAQSDALLNLMEKGEGIHHRKIEDKYNKIKIEIDELQKQIDTARAAETCAVDSSANVSPRPTSGAEAVE